VGQAADGVRSVGRATGFTGSPAPSRPVEPPLTRRSRTYRRDPPDPGGSPRLSRDRRRVDPSRPPDSHLGPCRPCLDEAGPQSCPLLDSRADPVLRISVGPEIRPSLLAGAGRAEGPQRARQRPVIAVDSIDDPRSMEKRGDCQVALAEQVTADRRARRRSSCSRARSLRRLRRPYSRFGRLEGRESDAEPTLRRGTPTASAAPERAVAARCPRGG